LRLDLKEGALARLKSDNFAIVPGNPEKKCARWAHHDEG